jgi:hypothetical protein
MSDTPTTAQADEKAREIAKLIDDLRPYAHKTLGSIRIDVSEVRKLVEAYDAAALRPVAWCWRFHNGPWNVTDSSPEDGAYDHLEHEPLYTTPPAPAQVEAASLPAPGGVVGVKIKPLVWREPDKLSNGCWTADCILGTFSVAFDDGWHACLEDGALWEWEPENDPRSYEGPFAAQAACQALLDSRIRAALAPDASPSGEMKPGQTVRVDVKVGYASPEASAALASPSGEEHRHDD